MGLFEEKKEKPAKPDEEVLPARVRRALLAAAHEWVAAHLGDDHRIHSYVHSRLERLLNSAIDRAVGIDEAFSRVEVKWNSPIAKLVEATAQKRAQVLMERYLKAEEKNLDKKLPEALKKAVNARYEDAYKGALLDLAHERGQERAQEDLDKLLGDKDKK